MAEEVERPTATDPSQYTDSETFSVEAQGHDLTFYPSGADRLDQLVKTIGDAQESLRMFYYMFQEDEAGTRVRDAIAEAAGRGVTVSLLIDRFGTDAPDEFFDPIVENGGHFGVFSKKKTRRYLIRNHQKICIADERVAMVGGFNVSDNYFAPPCENGWCDLGCRMTGPVVDDLLRWYDQLREYSADDDAQYRAVRKLIKDWHPGDGPVQLTLGGPTRSSSNWARRVKSDLVRAKRLDMAMAYFSPPRSFRRLIRRIAKRGKVRLMMAGKSDNQTTIAAARATYRQTLKAGGEIYEFQPCKLHKKLIVIDDITYFGSANFDHRSIRLNLELMFRFEDAGLADRMRQHIDEMTEAALKVTPEYHRTHSSLWNRFKWWLGWTMVSTVDYTVARRLNVDA